ncbi:Hsp20/alpha crystallin family protein [Mesorhizobium sp. KR1-2]|uniref:Hsp20/alpha crystallin family protein n=1 Tax=Mesorhizobium sp. KR1-2 TaxID=3156609 RepID=UPI0032B5B04F
MNSLRHEIQKVFDEFSQGFWPSGTLNAAEVVPEMDIHDNGKKVRLSLEVPGVEERDIDIAVSGRVITISGEKKASMEAATGGMHRSERSYGSFSRSVSLPFDIDAGKVKAKLDNGVLTVTVSKPAGAVQQTRKISIGG